MIDHSSTTQRLCPEYYVTNANSKRAVLDSDSAQSETQLNQTPKLSADPLQSQFCFSYRSESSATSSDAIYVVKHYDFVEDTNTGLNCLRFEGPIGFVVRDQIYRQIRMLY